MRGHYRDLASFLIGLAILAYPPSIKADQGTGTRPAVETTVRFDLYRGYLIVARGSAGPLKGLNFLLDTGASPSVLDRRLARKLHLEELPASVGVLDGRVQAGRAIASDLEFGPNRRENFPVLIEDLSFLERALSVRIDGVIGLDVLGKSTFEIDYPAREIRFGAPRPLPVSIPIRIKDGLATVDAQVNQAPVRLLVDTGASSLIVFQSRMPGTVLGLKVSAVQRSANLSGDFERKQVWLRSLRLGDAEFGQESASLVQDRRDAGQDFDGLLSPAALGIARIAVDPQRGVMAFSR